MASTLIRWTCASAVLDLIREDPDMSGVSVTAGWPGDAQLPEMVWLLDLDGDLEIPVMTADRKYRDDRFEMVFRVRVMQKASVDDCMNRMSEMVGAIESILADRATVDDLDGVVSAETTFVGMAAGTDTKNGHTAIGEVRVSVHARLT